jgi:hypothetical protein
MPSTTRASGLQLCCCVLQLHISDYVKYLTLRSLQGKTGGSSRLSRQQPPKAVLHETYTAATAAATASRSLLLRTQTTPVMPATAQYRRPHCISHILLLLLPQLPAGTARDILCCWSQGAPVMPATAQARWSSSLYIFSRRTPTAFVSSSCSSNRRAKARR